MSEQGGARSWSLERQLQWRLIGALIGIWLLGSAGALVGVWHETGEVLDSALTEVGQRLLVLPDSALADDQGQNLFSAIAEHEEFVIYQVYDGQGRLRLRSHAAPQVELDQGAADGFRQNELWRVLTLTRSDRGRRVQVAESVQHRHQVLWESLLWLLVPLGAVLPVAAGTLRLLVRLAFRSIEPARRQLAERVAQDLRPVDDVALPRELQPWIATINELIGKVRSLVDAERTFAAQTAHEVRTPLAAARAQAQRLTITATDEATRERAQALLRQLDRLARLVTRLLQLARIESGVPLKREAVDLVALAHLVADEFADARASGRLRVEVHCASAPVRADLDVLGIAVRNLIDNALKYSGPQAHVTVAVTASTLSVIDNGPGVAPPLLASLVRPFGRGQVLSEGTGLGLAIVERIARQSGGALKLASPLDSGEGFAAALEFPV